MSNPIDTFVETTNTLTSLANGLYADATHTLTQQSKAALAWTEKVSRNPQDTLEASARLTQQFTDNSLVSLQKASAASLQILEATGKALSQSIDAGASALKAAQSQTKANAPKSAPAASGTTAA